MTLASGASACPRVGPAATRASLPVGGPATEYRAAYPHVCRAGFDGGFEVGAHARRDPRRGGIHATYESGDRGEVRERWNGIRAERGDRHPPAKPQSLGRDDLLRERLGLVRCSTGAPGAGILV